MRSSCPYGRVRIALRVTFFLVLRRCLYRLPFDCDEAQSAKNRNYYATKEFVEREKRKALREIDHKMEDKALTYEQHIREQRLIEAKYSPY